MWHPSRLVAVGLLLLATAVFQAWFMGIPTAAATHPAPVDLVDTYTQALARGHSDIGVADEQHRVLDASYFRGRVYVYYGIAPFVLLLVPWFKITGTFLSPAVAIFGALLIGYAACGWSLVLLAREDRRRLLNALVPAGFVATVVGSGTWCLMEMANIHQIEAAWGYAFTSLTMASLVTAWTFPRVRTLACGAAMGFAGLIMACRPNCLPSVVAFTVIAGVTAWRDELGATRKWRRLLVAGSPLLVIATALGVWNFVRFGSVFEFGMNYGTGALGRPHIVGFSGGNVLYNLHRYLFGGFRVGDYFPFMDSVKEGPFLRPEKTHESVDQVYGCVILLPVLVFAAVTLWKRKWAAAAVALGAAGNLFFLSGLGFGSYRYEVDFLGAVSFLAAVGICFLAEIPGKRTRGLLVGGAAISLAYSVAAGLCQAASIARIHNLFDARRPEDFSALAFPFNRAAYAWEKIHHGGPRALRLTLRLPASRFGEAEPLVVTGERGLQDFLYFYYAGPGLLRVGFESMGQGGPVAPLLKIDYAQPHRVEIFHGDMLPPDDHPMLCGIPEGDRSVARQLVRVTIDGTVALEDFVRLHPLRSRIFFGESPDNHAFGGVFTGTISRLERPLVSELGGPPTWNREAFGPIVLEFQLKPRDIGLNFPLVSVGNAPRNGLLVLQCLNESQVRFKWLGFEGPDLSSDPIAWSVGKVQRLELSVGPFFPPSGSSLWRSDVALATKETLKRTLRVIRDGEEVWRTELRLPDVPPSIIRVGENALFRPNIQPALHLEAPPSRAPW